MDTPLPSLPQKGRGAVSAPAGRFEPLQGCAVDDGWAEGQEAPPKLATRLHLDTARQVVNAIDSPDLGYARSVNPYRGCEHGCIYCYARPSHCYLGFSAGLDFETQIFHKPDAPQLLRAALSARNYRPTPILLGSNTDCYQPIERELQLTRAIVALLAETGHPLIITTKSALVVRDVDLLAEMAARNLARVAISVTSLDPVLARTMEPRAAAPAKRLKAIETLARAGVPVTVMAAPMIPGLNDVELERVLQAAHDAGAREANYTLVRLPYELKNLFEEWLRAHYPERAERVLALIRETRGGKLNDSTYGQRMTGQGVYADLLVQRFRVAVKKCGFARKQAALRTDLFRPPQTNVQLAFGF